MGPRPECAAPSARAHGEPASCPSLREYNRIYGVSRARLGRVTSEPLLILHPGPMNRGVEIDSDVADGPHSVILQQVTNGVAVRMAVLYLLSGGRAREGGGGQGWSGGVNRQGDARRPLLDSAAAAIIDPACRESTPRWRPAADRTGGWPSAAGGWLGIPDGGAGGGVRAGWWSRPASSTCTCTCASPGGEHKETILPRGHTGRRGRRVHLGVRHAQHQRRPSTIPPRWALWWRKVRRAGGAPGSTRWAAISESGLQVASWLAEIGRDGGGGSGRHHRRRPPGHGLRPDAPRPRVLAASFGMPVADHPEDLGLSRDGSDERGAGVRRAWVSVGKPNASEDIHIRARPPPGRAHRRPHPSPARLDRPGAWRRSGSAKARGVRATAEASPHHLILTEAAVRGVPHRRQDEPAAAHRPADVAAVREGPRRTAPWT